jgi:glycosyltransferase involved in cell wall biosynthesis
VAVGTRAAGAGAGLSAARLGRLARRRLRQPGDPPLFIDFRDAWLDDPVRADYYRNPLRRWREQRMEARTLGQAAGCLVVSPSMAEDFRCRYPALADRFHLLMNGYDEADWRDLPALAPLPAGSLNLVYTGSFPGYRTPRFVLQALAELNAPDIRFDLIGDSSGKAQRLVRQQWPWLADRVHFHPRASQALALAWQQAADVLLLIVAPGPRGDETRMEVTSKVFEYLRSRRPLLATLPPGGDLDRLLAPLPWVTRVAATDVPGIQAALRHALARKKAGTLAGPAGDGLIEAYRRDRQMSALAQLLIDISMSSGMKQAA